MTRIPYQTAAEAAAIEQIAADQKRAAAREELRAAMAVATVRLYAAAAEIAAEIEAEAEGRYPIVL